METIRDAAVLAGGTEAGNLSRLAEWLSHDDATVRYWAATGIGNRSGNQNSSAGTTNTLIALLQDESENVRVAAARALMGRGKSGLALHSLSQVLDDGTQWGACARGNCAG